MVSFIPSFHIVTFTDEGLTDESEPRQRRVPSGAVPVSSSFLHQLLKFKCISIIDICLLMGGYNLYCNADLFKFRCISLSSHKVNKSCRYSLLQLKCSLACHIPLAHLLHFTASCMPYSILGRPCKIILCRLEFGCTF